MTAREAEALLFDAATSQSATCKADAPERRRVDAIYCPRCSGWVEVRLRPVRLHCTGCGLEAKP